MKPEPQRGAGRASAYHYRRALTLPEMLPAIGVAVGVGAAAFYVARLFLQRTPLVPASDIPKLGPARVRAPRSAHEAASGRRGARSSTRALPPLPPPPTITRRNARRVDAG